MCVCVCIYFYLFYFAGRNIYRTLFKLKPPERNELFLPKRMAYAVDLEDEFGDFDIPNTIIRSKADCPSLEVSGMNEEECILTSNDFFKKKCFGPAHSHMFACVCFIMLCMNKYVY